jgi:hypothetical protein
MCIKNDINISLLLNFVTNYDFKILFYINIFEFYFKLFYQNFLRIFYLTINYNL